VSQDVVCVELVNELTTSSSRGIRRLQIGGMEGTRWPRCDIHL
jgi:hypothetical protein